MLNNVMYTSPAVAVFNVTFKCQLQCGICNIENITRSRGELTTQQVISVLEDLSKSGISTVDFVGGEALVREDITEILESARGLFTEVRLVTNGVLGVQHLDLFLGLPVDHISISLDGSTSGTHDSIRGEGVFVRVMDFLQQLKAKKEPKIRPLTTINTVIVKNNVAELVSILELADSLNINNVTYEVFLFDNANLRLKKSESPFWIQGDDVRVLADQIKKIIRIKTTRSKPICVASTLAYLNSIEDYYTDSLIPEGFTCRNGTDFITIAADGRVHICEYLIGDATQENFLSILNGDNMRYALNQVAHCARPCMMNCMVGGVENHAAK